MPKRRFTVLIPSEEGSRAIPAVEIAEARSELNCMISMLFFYVTRTYPSGAIGGGIFMLMLVIGLFSLFAWEDFTDSTTI
jgi:hypothetical protein